MNYLEKEVFNLKIEMMLLKYSSVTSIYKELNTFYIYIQNKSNLDEIKELFGNLKRNSSEISYKILLPKLKELCN